MRTFFRTLVWTLPFALALMTRPAFPQDCELPQERDPEVLFDRINELSTQELAKFDDISLRAPDAQAQASRIRVKVFAELSKFEAAGACLLQHGLIDKKAFSAMKDQARLIRQMT